MTSLVGQRDQPGEQEDSQLGTLSRHFASHSFTPVVCWFMHSAAHSSCQDLQVAALQPE